MKCKALRWRSFAPLLVGCVGGATPASHGVLVDQTIRSQVEVGELSFDSTTMAELSVSETDAGARWRFEYVALNRAVGADNDRMVSLQVAQDGAPPWGTFDISGPRAMAGEVTLRYVQYMGGTAVAAAASTPSGASNVAAPPRAVSAQQGDRDYREYRATSGRLDIVRPNETQAVVELRGLTVVSVEDADDTLTFDGTITTQVRRSCYAFDAPNSNAVPAASGSIPQVGQSTTPTSELLLNRDEALATEFCKQQSQFD